MAGACVRGRTPSEANPAAAASSSIDKKRFVSIGGIEQWITIKGDRRDNPVVLFLHGGPGNPMSPFADQVFGSDWRERFTLVQWDQRGAGRTFGRTGPSIAPTMTMDRMVQDGIEVTEFLERHLRRSKIILTGGSWGSILGVQMVKARPDLYCGYVGMGQIVNMKETLVAAHRRVLEVARTAGDQKAIGELTAVGEPPGKTLRQAGAILRWAHIFEAGAVAPFITSIAPEYASAKDQADRQASDELSLVQFVGATLEGPLMQVDLAALGTRFDIPFFILGPDTAHEPSRASIDLLLEVMKQRIRPRCGK